MRNGHQQLNQEEGARNGEQTIGIAEQPALAKAVQIKQEKGAISKRRKVTTYLWTYHAKLHMSRD
jgi:hypothetical protein